MNVDRTSLGMAAVSVPASVALGVLVGSGRHGLVLQLLLLVVAAWLIFAAPPRAMVWVAGAGALIAPTSYPLLAAIGGVDIFVGDALLAVAALAALARGRGPVWKPAVWTLGAMVAIALVRSEFVGFVAFGRLMLPVAVLLLLARLLPAGYDIWRDLRWGLPLVLTSVWWAGGIASARWFSWAGGPNETALLAALTVVLGFSQRHRGWKAFLVLTGVAVLAGTAAVTGTVAMGAGVLIYSIQPRLAARGFGRGAPIVAVWLVLTAAIMLPLLRVNIAGTIEAHLFQLSTLPSFTLLGSGWANVDSSAFITSDVEGLHNVYFDVFAFLGAFGLAALVALLVTMFRRADPVTRALIATWAVWVNTTGAFPGVAWGVLGFLVCAMALQQVANDRDVASGEARPGAPVDATPVNFVSGGRRSPQPAGS